MNSEKITSFNMMHYTPWPQQQIIMDNQRYYAQYMEELSHYHHHHHHHRPDPIDENSEQTGDEMHDTMTSATSCDRSSSADLFRLEFAATQWSKLVSNAEGLFNKLIVSNILPHNEQDQIEQWLCMKQEYEECITSDDTASFQGFADNARRSLEIIEEVTETDEKTDESGNRMDYRDRSETCSETESEISEEEEDDEDDDDDDDDDVEDDEDEDDEEEDLSDTNSENPDFIERLDECINKFIIETDGVIDLNREEFQEIGTPIPQISRNNNDSSPIMKAPPKRNPNMRRNSMLPGSEMCNGLLAFNDNFKLTQGQNIQTDSSSSFNLSKISETTQSCNELESRNINTEIAIIAQSENSPNLFMDVLLNSDTPGPIKELKALTKNNKAKQKEVLKIQSDLEGAHKRIEELQSTIEIKERFIAEMIKNSDTRSSAKQRFHRKRTKLKEEYYNTRTQLAHAESAFTNNETGERSTYKNEIELYRNMAFHYEKKLMDIEIIRQIAGDSAKKVRKLENSLSSSKKQMEELTRQLKKEELLKKQLEDEVAEDQKKIRDLEEKYNLTASKLKEIQSESEDERAKSRSESSKKNLLDVSDRISHLDQVLKKKSMDLDKTADTDERKALRLEIQNFRDTRDRLIDEKTRTTVDERNLLEYDETIEVIDTVIEHKNEMICGRKYFDEDPKGNKFLENLEKLTDGEMKNLFHTYFTKVIDLKQNLQSLENENNYLKYQYQRVYNGLKQNEIEAEKRDVLMQEKYQRQMNLMLKQFAENSSSSGHEKMDNDSEIARYRKEIRILKKRLQDVETHYKEPPTKVTREKNKLIIQKTTDSDKRKK
ncbi:kinesin-like protein costa [Leptopilina boulardi]|uniref:kinesin-like protein costa n=1 Tax=Leptopilina boulardi TaxID=63433 RepID=UPI0021F5D654|nr:kinesin-like protein costa [Leptopilina boulardi]